MLIIDTETTSLTAPSSAPLSSQPYIMEFAAVKLDDKTLKRKADLLFRCSVPIPVPADAQKITGIKDADLTGQPPFITHLSLLQEFFLGERTLVAHNLSFDRDCLLYELMRCGKVTVFPWPIHQVCTVEANMHIVGYRMTLSDLFKHATKGKEHREAHRAVADVDALVAIVEWMRKEGRI